MQFLRKAKWGVHRPVLTVIMRGEEQTLCRNKFDRATTAYLQHTFKMTTQQLCCIRRLVLTCGTMLPQ